MTTNLEHTLEVAIGRVLFNVSNFPEPAHSKLWGQDMKPLNDKLTSVLAPVVRRIQAEAWERGAWDQTENIARQMWDDGDPISNPYES